jgi:hypothetical protein
METAMIQATEFEAPQTTDPREAKLKDIIEKGKVSLHKTLEEIQHEFAIREDMTVRPTAIDFLVQGPRGTLLTSLNNCAKRVVIPMREAMKEVECPAKRDWMLREPFIMR